MKTLTTADIILAALWLGLAIFLYLTRRASRAADPSHHPVYMKCRDCGLEHAVYQNGKVHALRPEPKANQYRRPGAED